MSYLSDQTDEFGIPTSEPEKSLVSDAKEDLRGFTTAKLKQLETEPHNPDTGLEVDSDAVTGELNRRYEKRADRIVRQHIRQKQSKKKEPEKPADKPEDWLGESMLSESVNDWGIPLLEDFKTSAKRFQEQGAEQTEVDAYISDFKALKDRIKEAERRDIDRWKNWSEFKAFIDELKSTKSKTQAKKLAKQEGAELVAENENWWVYKITDHKAVMLYGSGTKWCITQENPSYWEGYASDSHFYFLISKEERQDNWDKIAVQVTVKGKVVFWDAGDQHHSLDDITKQNLNLPDLDSFLNTPEEPMVVIDGKQVTETEFYDSLWDEKSGALQSLVKEMGPRFQETARPWKGGVLVLNEPFYEFVESLKSMYGKLDLPDLDEFIDIPWGWGEMGWAVEDIIDKVSSKLPEAEYNKVMDELLRVAKENGVIEEDSDEISPREMEQLFSEYRDDINENLVSAVTYAIDDGWQVGTDNARRKYVKRLAVDADFGDGEEVVEGKDGNFSLYIPAKAIFSWRREDTEPSMSIESSRDGYESDFDDAAAVDRLAETLYETGFLTAQKS